MVNTGLRVVAFDSSPQDPIFYSIFHIPHTCQHINLPALENSAGNSSFLISCCSNQFEKQKSLTSQVLNHNSTNRHSFSSSYSSSKGTFEEVSEFSYLNSLSVAVSYQSDFSDVGHSYCVQQVGILTGSGQLCVHCNVCSKRQATFNSPHFLASSCAEEGVSFSLSAKNA